DAASVTLECDRRLAGLFESSFAGVTVIPRSTPPVWSAEDFDLVLPSGSLGRLYRNALADFPDRGSYLKPDDAAAAYWQNRISSLGTGLKVGISWRGGIERTGREARSIPLHLWGPILGLEHIHFVSLQYGDVKAEVDAASASLSRPITRFEPSEI